MKKTWQGRFKKNLDTDADKFNASMFFDVKLFRYDIAAGIAHSRALLKAGIISRAEAAKIEKGLAKVLEKERTIDFAKYEDVHSAVEMELVAGIGDTGKKLHTGRSRNDLVATDTRMYVRDQAEELKSLMLNLMNTLLELADKNKKTYMPGYTHMQQAQIVSAAQWGLAYFSMLRRDYGLLCFAQERANVMPLGSGAIAGSNFAIDREFTAKQLGFSGPCSNSMDGVSDRDFMADMCYFSAMASMHLSRMAEEIIIYNTMEFAFVEIDDSFATGSSLMPQKKNPDIAELIRGKSSGIIGSLTSALVLMKGLPLAYNKDMQEDKVILFRTIDEIKNIVFIAEKFLKNITFRQDKINVQLGNSFLYSVDIADFLVNKGVAFRDAHEITGKLVAYCVDNNKQFWDLTGEELKGISSSLDDSFFGLLKPERSVNMKMTIGSPSVKSVEKQISEGRGFIKNEG
jgi:argininosuccinate lyase